MNSPVNSQTASNLLYHMRKHGVTISMPRDMTSEELKSAFHYGAHTSAQKERGFVQEEMSEKKDLG